MTVNLLKRLESSVESFRLTLNALRRNHQGTLAKIAAFNQSGASASVGDLTEVLANLEGDDDELPILDDETVRSVTRSRSASPTWTCLRGSTT
jgi:hypothetical protein